MADLLVLIRRIFPEHVYGSFENYSLQKANSSQLISIEDYIFKDSGEKLQLPQDSFSIVTIPGQNANSTTIDDFLIITEFSIALLVTKGHPFVFGAGVFSGEKCIFAKMTQHDAESSSCEFSEQLTGIAISQWIKRCFLVYKNIKSRLHVTAHRYVRYSRATKDLDSLLDLCISLESLVGSQTEISFRFSTTLAKVINLPPNEAKDFSDVLYKLYDLRSKIVHGDSEANKVLRKFATNLPKLHDGAVRILTTYIYYVSDHSYDDWKTHLKNSVFS